MFRQVFPGPAGLHGLGDGQVRLHRLLAAAQDDRVGCFNAKAGRIGGDVRARLVDDSDDADGRPDFLNHETVGANPAADLCADRVLQPDHRAQALDHGVDARVAQEQSVEQGGGHAGLPARLHVPGVGGLDRLAARVQFFRHGFQDQVLPARGKTGQGAGGRNGPVAHQHHVVVQAHDNLPNSMPSTTMLSRCITSS